MLRVVRRAVPVALVIAIGLQGSAFAATKNVTVANFSFTPKTTSAGLGDTVLWTNTATATNHTSTHDTTDPLVWDSGTITPGGGTFSFLFNVAGSFTYHCNFHPTLMMGTINVKPKAKPASGVAGTKFTIGAALVAATGTLVYDVQMKVPGGQFVDFVLGNTTGKVTFDSTGMATGVYQFRARLRDTATGNAAAYSPPVSITVM
jgi:plastocyanin